MPRLHGRTAYVALLALGGLDAAGYSVIAPVVPAISEDTGAGPWVIGLLVSFFAIGQVVGYPLAGRGIQRRNAAWVLGLALACMAVGDLAFVLGEGLWVYFPARLLQGVGAGGLWLGVVFGVLERFPGEEYRRLTGILGAYSIGAVAGPALGAIGGIRGPFLAHLVLVCVAAFVVWGLGAPSERPAFGSERAALRAPGFRLASAAIILVALSLGTLEGPLPLHFDDLLSQSRIGLLYLATSLMVGLSAMLAGRVQPRVALALGASFLVGGIALAGATDTVPWWVAASAIVGIGLGAGEAGSIGILLETVGTDRIVLALVVWSQLWAFGYLVGPAAAGGVADALGFGAVGIVPFGAALVVAVAFLRAPKPRATPV
ncbi:MAG: MFS transporter [Gaiellaceae bacterium]